MHHCLARVNLFLINYFFIRVSIEREIMAGGLYTHRTRLAQVLTFYDFEPLIAHRLITDNLCLFLWFFEHYW